MDNKHSFLFWELLLHQRAHGMPFKEEYCTSNILQHMWKCPPEKQKLDGCIQISIHTTLSRFSSTVPGFNGTFCRDYFCSFLLPWTRFYVPLQIILLLMPFKKPRCSSMQPPRGLKACLHLRLSVHLQQLYFKHSLICLHSDVGSLHVRLQLCYRLKCVTVRIITKSKETGSKVRHNETEQETAALEAAICSIKKEKLNHTLWRNQANGLLGRWAKRA